MTYILRKKLNWEDICVQIQQISGSGAKHTSYGRAQHESICRPPVLEPVGLVNMWDCHLDPNRFKCRITWPTDDYLQVTCMYLRMPKAPWWLHTPARKWQGCPQSWPGLVGLLRWSLAHAAWQSLAHAAWQLLAMHHGSHVRSVEKPTACCAEQLITHPRKVTWGLCHYSCLHNSRHETFHFEKK